MQLPSQYARFLLTLSSYGRKSGSSGPSCDRFCVCGRTSTCTLSPPPATTTTPAPEDRRRRPSWSVFPAACPSQCWTDELCSTESRWSQLNRHRAQVSSVTQSVGGNRGRRSKKMGIIITKKQKNEDEEKQQLDTK